MMSDAELRELADENKANGLMDRIVIHDGMILDGRNLLVALVAGKGALFGVHWFPFSGAFPVPPRGGFAPLSGARQRG